MIQPTQALNMTGAESEASSVEEGCQFRKFLMNLNASSADERPLVTVVTATYNLIKSGRQDYIRECIESVHNQTYPNIEHLIIDGASTDGTLDLLSEYEQKGWLTIHSEPDKGIYDAFNKGLKLAKGKYIAFLNSDDYWHNGGGVESSVHLLEKQKACFSYSGWLLASNNGKQKSRQQPRISSFFYRTPFCHQTMFTLTDSLRELSGFDLHYNIFADLDVIIKLLIRKAKVVYVPLCFTTFRNGGLSSDREQNAQVLEQKKSVYRNNFASLLAPEQHIENELQLHNRRRLSRTFLAALEKKLHPVIFQELSIRCQWYEDESVWYYCTAMGSRRFGNSSLARTIIYLLNRLMPHWHTKLLNLRKHVKK